MKIDFEFDDEINKGLNHVIDRFMEKGYTLHEGRVRVVLIDPSKRMVIKIPLNMEGEIDNGREASHWKTNLKGDNFIPVAACRLSEVMGYNLLIMQYIEEIPINELPEWAGYVDCSQVGKNRAGKFKAYDL